LQIVDGNSLQVDSQAKSVGLVWGLVLSLQLSNKLSELLQWPCHNDSTINIITGICISTTVRSWPWWVRWAAADIWVFAGRV